MANERALGQGATAREAREKAICANLNSSQISAPPVRFTLRLTTFDVTTLGIEPNSAGKILRLVNQAYKVIRSYA